MFKIQSHTKQWSVTSCLVECCPSQTIHTLLKTPMTGRDRQEKQADFGIDAQKWSSESTIQQMLIQLKLTCGALDDS